MVIGILIQIIWGEVAGELKNRNKNQKAGQQELFS
jgi:hypothetical protein